MAKSIKAEEFDRIFDEGEEDIVEYLDLSTVRRPNLDTDLRRVNVDFPEVDDRRAGSRGQAHWHQTARRSSRPGSPSASTACASPARRRWRALSNAGCRTC